MKKIFVLLLTIVGVFISSCDSTTDPITPAETGKIFITSTPSGAQIWVGGVNSGKMTPDTLTNLDVKPYSITLKLADYFDSTYTVNVVANQTVQSNITLKSNLFLEKFTSVRIWETLAPSTTQPSGLDLSSGQAVAVSGTDKMSVDIYYSSNGFLVQSAHLNTTQGLTRVTKFNIGSSNNIDDGVDSPIQNTSWATNVNDLTSDYFYLYDADGHYSKARITGRGSSPDAWVEITWWYNKTASDTRF